MITFPNAKINLGLHIVEKRPDGYHNLETIFYPIRIHDALEIAVNEDNEDIFTNSGIEIEGNSNSNLCIRALNLLRERHNIPPLKIHLHKNIPMGAGLGGGSADGAYMLNMLNDKFKLELSTFQLQQYAQRLGADCAFFIENKPALAKGIGDILSPIDVDLSKFHLVVIKPDIHITSLQAYQNIKPKKSEYQLEDLIKNPKEWKNKLVNDFEAVIFPQYPKLKALKEDLYNRGAIYASMSGSGSAIFALFEQMPFIELDEAITYYNC